MEFIKLKIQNNNLKKMSFWKNLLCIITVATTIVSHSSVVAETVEAYFNRVCQAIIKEKNEKIRVNDEIRGLVNMALTKTNLEHLARHNLSKHIEEETGRSTIKFTLKRNKITEAALNAAANGPLDVAELTSKQVEPVKILMQQSITNFMKRKDLYAKIGRANLNQLTIYETITRQEFREIQGNAKTVKEDDEAGSGFTLGLVISLDEQRQLIINHFWMIL